MPTLSLTYLGANGQPHDWSHVQTPLDEIKTLLNTTGLDYVNVQQYGLKTDRTRAHAGILSGPIKVRNASGSTLNANDLVYVSGTYSDGTDNYPTVAPAIATASASTNYPAMLVVDSSISNNGNGTAYLVKGITEVNTSGGAVGDAVYLSTSAGAWTLTRPTGNQFVQVVGYIEVVHASTGRIVLCPQVPQEEAVFGAAGGLGIWLDANRDSGFLASGADTLQVYLNNAADFQFGVNQFSALDGSSIVVGGTAAQTTSAAGTLQVLGTAAADATLIQGRWSADALGPVHSLVKSRNATIGSSTIVQDNDVLGTIEFMADDGGDFATPGATIFARVNGTPGANDMPTELVFATTADGANSVTERASFLADGTFAPIANDGIALGSTTLGWADLHLATGGVINWANGEVTITETDGNTLTIAGVATRLDLAAGILEMNNAIEWDTGVAVVGTEYSVGRDADGTNQLHFNVPTGASFEWSVNDAATMTLSTTTLTLGSAVTGVVVPDNMFIGLGSGAGRIEFDDQATDEVNFLECHVGIGTSTPITNFMLHVVAPTNAGTLQGENNGASPFGIQINFSAASPDNNTNYFFLGNDNTTNRIFIYSDGDLQNHDNSYGAISDVALKQDIVDARSYWEDWKQIRYRKFRFKSDVEADPDAGTQIGVVAQELETVFPGLVEANMETGMKGVKYSVMDVIAGRVLQECIERIEALEAA